MSSTELETENVAYLSDEIRSKNTGKNYCYNVICRVETSQEGKL